MMPSAPVMVIMANIAPRPTNAPPSAASMNCVDRPCLAFLMPAFSAETAIASGSSGSNAGASDA